MKNIVVAIFGVNELSETVKAKVLENHRYTNVENREWFDFMYDDFIERLAHAGFNVTSDQIHFSGFSSQGDGLSFDGDIDITKFTENKRIINLVNDDWVQFSITKNNYANHYCHEKTRSVIYEIYGGNRNEYNNLVELLETITRDIEAQRLDLCKDFYRELEKQYYYLISDEAIEETLIENDYEFFADGSLYTG